MADIPNMTRETAFLLGNWMRQGLVGLRKPVAYLYNGVRLVDIEGDLVDKDMLNDCPYRVIAYDTNEGEFYLFISTTPWQFDGSQVFASKSVAYEKYHHFVTSNGTVWWRQGGGIFASVYLNSDHNCDRCIWTSHDIINTADGSVFLAATDPVPVYE